MKHMTSRSLKALFGSSSELPCIAEVPRRATAGFSLTELLATMAILALVGIVVVTGLPAVHRAYVAAVDASNAQVLLSTATTRLRDELSVANPNDPQSEPDDVTKSVTYTVNNVEKTATQYVSFESLETGYTTSIVSNEEMGLFILETSDSGYSAPTRLVPENLTKGAGNDANGDLKVVLSGDDCGISWHGETKTFTITGLKVQRGSGDAVANADSGGTITVRAIA